MSIIADKLNMKTIDLVRLNPDVTNEPVTDSFIVVPENKMSSFKDQIKVNVDNSNKKDTIIIDDTSEKENHLDELKEKFETYEVQKGDTFYSLNRNYNVSRDELLLLNPELKEGLKVGMIIKIKEKIDEVEVIGDFYTDYIQNGIDLKIALLLPFKTNTYRDSLSPKKAFTKNATLMNITTDFYMGAEIAVDSLRQQGVNIEFNVYDTGSRNTNINNLISEENLNKNDAIIGPIYSDEVENIAKNVNVPIIFPVYSSSQSKFNSSNVVKTSPDKNIFREELASYFIDSLTQGTLIIITDDKYKSIEKSSSFQASLAGSNIDEIHVLSPEKGFIDKSRFLKVLKPNEKNWVVMATDNNVIVADVINSLIGLPNDISAKLFAMDKEKVYDEIDNKKLARVGFTFVSNEFVDETSLVSKVFSRQYKDKNNALPSFYATKGFDITYDILVRLASGNSLKSTFKEGASFRVETKFDYTKKNKVSSNKGLFILQYNKDLTITKLK